MTDARRLMAALLVAGTWALAPGPVGAAETTLKISTIVPAGSSFMQQMRKADQAVRERTEGRVELKFFPGGVMGSDQAVMRKMRIGQLHGAVITATGSNNIDPAAQVYSLPFTFRNHDELQFVRERIDPVIRERVRAHGYELAGMAEGGFTYLFSKKPIRQLSDLSDVRMWAPQGDDITARMLEDAGAQVVSLPLSDVYTSLQTGLVDTVTVNPTGVIGLQWHTGVDYQTDLPLLMLMAMMVIDQRALDRLSEPDRTAVLDVIGETFESLDAMNRESDREAQQALREAGIELVEPTRPPGKQRWKESAESSLRALAEAGEFRDELYLRVLSLVSEYRDRTAAQ